MRVLALSKSPEGCCPREMTSPIWVITSLGTACVGGVGGGVVCVCVCGGVVWTATCSCYHKCMSAL